MVVMVAVVVRLKKQAKNHETYVDQVVVDPMVYDVWLMVIPEHVGTLVADVLEPSGAVEVDEEVAERTLVVVVVVTKKILILVD